MEPDYSALMEQGGVLVLLLAYLRHRFAVIDRALSKLEQRAEAQSQAHMKRKPSDDETEE